MIIIDYDIDLAIEEDLDHLLGMDVDHQKELVHCI